MRDRSKEVRDDDQVDLNERVETVSELLVAAGSESINNEALEHFSELLSSSSFSDLPEEPQSYDSSLECLITVLENCRSAHDEVFGEQAMELPLVRPYPEKKRSSSRRLKRSEASIGNSIASPATAKSTLPENTELRLQEQFEKYKKSSTKPKDGLSCADTRPFSTSSVTVDSNNKQRSFAEYPVSPTKCRKRSSPSKRKVKLQDQFNKSYNKKAHPKIGPGHSDIITEVSDLTMPSLSGDKVKGKKSSGKHS